MSNDPHPFCENLALGVLLTLAFAGICLGLALDGARAQLRRAR